MFNATLFNASVEVETRNVSKIVNVLGVCIYGRDWIMTFDPDFRVNQVSEGPIAVLLLKEEIILPCPIDKSRELSEAKKD